LRCDRRGGPAFAEAATACGFRGPEIDPCRHAADASSKFGGRSIKDWSSGLLLESSVARRCAVSRRTALRTVFTPSLPGKNAYPPVDLLLAALDLGRVDIDVELGYRAITMDGMPAVC